MCMGDIGLGYPLIIYGTPRASAGAGPSLRWDWAECVLRRTPLLLSAQRRSECGYDSRRRSVAPCLAAIPSKPSSSFRPLQRRWRSGRGGIRGAPAGILPRERAQAPSSKPIISDPSPVAKARAPEVGHGRPGCCGAVCALARSPRSCWKSGAAHSANSAWARAAVALE